MGCKKLLCILFFFGFITVSTAQKVKSFFPYFKYDTDTTNSFKNKELSILPIIYRSPETRFATGLFFMAIFRMKGTNDTSARSSNFAMPFVITQNQQYTFGFQYNIIFKNERLFWRGFNVLEDFNEYFYGAGNKAILRPEQVIRYNFLRITQRLSYRVFKRHFIGIQYNMYKTWHLTGGTNLDDPDLLGTRHGGYISSGIGFSYLFDTRDNILTSTKGSYLDLSYYNYRRPIGSDYAFDHVGIDGRYFINVRKKDVVAFHALLQFNFGEVPFMQLSHMGGVNMMRGYYYGRFRDKIHTALQAEYRLHLWKMFGLTFFGAVANIANTLSAYDIATLKAAGGAGLRVRLSKKEKVNLRLDIGFGENTWGYYLTVGEAF